MDSFTLTLNGKQVEFEPGQTILTVAENNGVRIPTLCHLKGCTPTGACRICLVEVAGARSLVASCSTPAEKGMVVETETDRVHRTRKLTTEFLMASGKHDCITCERSGACTLQDLAYRYGIDKVRFETATRPYENEDANPFIIRDFTRCILCGRCVQACQEVQVNRAISFGYRGPHAKIIAGVDVPYHESDCVFCGQCVQACPVGALIEKKSKFLGRIWDVRLSLIHISEPTRLLSTSYAVFCLKKKNNLTNSNSYPHQTKKKQQQHMITYPYSFHPTKHSSYTTTYTTQCA